MTPARHRKFVIASHGTLASGARSSLDIIIGRREDIVLLEAYVNENKTIEEELAELMKSIAAGEELVIFTDLLGGSITNQVLRTALRENVHIVSGYNLGLLIEVLMADELTPITEVIAAAIGNAKEQMVYVNDLVKSGQDQKTDD